MSAFFCNGCGTRIARLASPQSFCLECAPPGVPGSELHAADPEPETKPEAKAKAKTTSKAPAKTKAGASDLLSDEAIAAKALADEAAKAKADDDENALLEELQAEEDAKAAAEKDPKLS